MGCDMCGGVGGDYCGCGYDPTPPKKPDPPKDKTLDEILVTLYDLADDPNRDSKQIDRLLSAYKVITGKEKPGFML